MTINKINVKSSFKKKKKITEPISNCYQHQSLVTVWMHCYVYRHRKALVRLLPALIRKEIAPMSVLRKGLISFGRRGSLQNSEGKQNPQDYQTAQNHS